MFSFCRHILKYRRPESILLVSRDDAELCVDVYNSWRAYCEYLVL
jgi:hypothetical protein